MFRKRTFRENVRQLFLRIDVPDGNGWIREDAFEKPIQVDPVRASHMPHVRAPSFNTHLDDRVVVLKNDQPC